LSGFRRHCFRNWRDFLRLTIGQQTKCAARLAQSDLISVVQAGSGYVLMIHDHCALRKTFNNHLIVLKPYPGMQGQDRRIRYHNIVQMRVATNASIQLAQFQKLSL
jgi:hypothetical protein